MDNRLYFSVGDIIANMITGFLIAIICWSIVSTDWNMFIAMVLTMVLGMVISLPIALVFVAPYGAMEVMLPVMLTGMVSGMVVGMWESMHALSFMEASLLGLVCGLATIIVIWMINAQLRGKRTIDNSVQSVRMEGED